MTLWNTFTVLLPGETCWPLVSWTIADIIADIVSPRYLPNDQVNNFDYNNAHGNEPINQCYQWNLHTSTSIAVLRLYVGQMFCCWFCLHCISSVLGHQGKEGEVTYKSQVRPSVAGCICAMEWWSERKGEVWRNRRSTRKDCGEREGGGCWGDLCCPCKAAVYFCNPLQNS